MVDFSCHAYEKMIQWIILEFRQKKEYPSWFIYY